MEEQIDRDDFNVISQYIKSLCGREIPFSKEYLVRQKLENILEKNSFFSFRDFSVYLKDNKKVDFNDEIISALSVHETFFFRDIHPFEALENVIFKEILERKKLVNIWSNACSTGQEVFSLAISFERFKEKNGYGADKQYYILASDIDKRALKYAEDAVYTEAELKRGINEEYREKYFEKNNEKFSIKKELRSHIHFMNYNVLNTEKQFDREFDIICIRNLLIYFDNELKRKIILSLYNKLAGGGYIILGAAESLFGMELPFEQVTIGQTILYRKKDIIDAV